MRPGSAHTWPPGAAEDGDGRGSGGTDTTRQRLHSETLGQVRTARNKYRRFEILLHLISVKMEPAL